MVTQKDQVQDVNDPLGRTQIEKDQAGGQRGIDEHAPRADPVEGSAQPGKSQSAENGADAIRGAQLHAGQTQLHDQDISEHAEPHCLPWDAEDHGEGADRDDDPSVEKRKLRGSEGHIGEP